MFLGLWDTSNLNATQLITSLVLISVTYHAQTEQKCLVTIRSANEEAKLSNRFWPQNENVTIFGWQIV